MKAVIMFNSRQRYSRLGGKVGAGFVLAIALLFIFGFLLGFYFDVSGGSSKIPMGVLLKTQLYCGEVTEMAELANILPAISETEGGASLNQWDVAFYNDGISKESVPTFVRTINTESGDETSTTALVRAPQKNLALTSLMTDTPQVLIYSTHTSEDYANGGTVLDVAHALKENLEGTYGIGAVVSDTVHDSPEWYKSYANSRQTASEMLSQYPDANLIIDLHRDSGVKKNVTTMEVNGESVAKTLLVVGSNLTMKHPNWEENLVTANTVGNCISAVNGDILRGVRVQKGRYNQHLTKNAILLEVGTNLNTLDEAKGTAKVVAEALSNYLATISY